MFEESEKILLPARFPLNVKKIGMLPIPGAVLTYRHFYPIHICHFHDIIKFLMDLFIPLINFI